MKRCENCNKPLVGKATMHTWCAKRVRERALERAAVNARVEGALLRPQGPAAKVIPFPVRRA